jgi:hypothetical protein
MRIESLKRRLAASASAALTVFVVAFLATSVSALQHPLTIGIHGGPNVPSLQGGTNEVSQGYTSRLGPYFGVSAEYPLGGVLSLCAELNYSSQGAQRNGMQPIPADPSLPLPPGTSVYASFDNEAILDYLEIPVLARVRWGSAIRFFADAGPYIGFLVRAKTVTEGTSLLYDESGAPLPYPEGDFGAETDITSDINSTNYGIGGGIGIEMPYGAGNIVFDTHFAYGLANIQKDAALNGENNTGSLAFTLGYTYPFGGPK